MLLLFFGVRNYLFWVRKKIFGLKSNLFGIRKNLFTSFIDLSSMQMRIKSEINTYFTAFIPSNSKQSQILKIGRKYFQN